MLTLCFAVLHAADTSPRKAHKVSHMNLDDQARMELLVRGFGSTEVFLLQKASTRSFPFARKKPQKDVEDFAKACSWPGVFCTADEVIKRINFSRTMHEGIDIGPSFPFGGGSIDLSCMPLTVVSFKINHQKLAGTIETAFLPRCMQSIQMTENKLIGGFDVASLPPALVNGYFNRNVLTGPIDLTDISPNIQLLNLANNAIEQREVVVGHFSSRLVAVDLKENKVGRVVDENGDEFVDPRVLV